MPQFIVSQEPKAKHRANLVIRIVVVDTKTKAEALRVSDGFFSHDDAFYKPKADLLKQNTPFNF